MSHSLFDSTELPVLQAHTHCVLIPRDPNYIYAYWNYTEEDIDRARNQLRFEGENSQLVLRVYDITQINFNGTNANHTWDLDVGLQPKDWYIHVWQDNADYCAEIGFRSTDNNFISLTRSNTVRTPPKTTSTRNDLIWQDIKIHKESRPYIKENIRERYQSLMVHRSKRKWNKEKQPLSQRVYQLSAQDIRAYYMKLFSKVSRKRRRASLENILKRIPGGISWQKVQPFIINPDLIKKAHPGASEGLGGSENLSGNQSASDGRLEKRKFFFEIWTELIVHGRTEADAVVFLNDKEVKLNPDGTFTLRYALPDGGIPLDFVAQSSDGIEQRHIITAVEREGTISFPKILGGPYG